MDLLPTLDSVKMLKLLYSPRTLNLTGAEETSKRWTKEKTELGEMNADKQQSF